MSNDEHFAQGHDGTGLGSRARTVRLALMLVALVLTFFVGSFFFLTDG